MDLKTIFKRVILLDLLIMVLIIASVFIESAEVTDFNTYFENDYSNALLIIYGIGLLIYLINLFLLYKFKSIGKQKIAQRGSIHGPLGYFAAPNLLRRRCGGEWGTRLKSIGN